MTPAAFIDANVPIYASGRESPYKQPCARVLMMAAEHPESFVTDAEVFQELLHRYLSLERWALGREIFNGFAEVMRDRIEPVYVGDVDLAARLADEHRTVSARDLVHAAVMHRLGTNQIVSSDADFDRLPGISRLNPAQVGEWGDSILAQ